MNEMAIHLGSKKRSCLATMTDTGLRVYSTDDEDVDRIKGSVSRSVSHGISGQRRLWRPGCLSPIKEQTSRRPVFPYLPPYV
jgi:hypothetical protein